MRSPPIERPTCLACALRYAQYMSCTSQSQSIVVTACRAARSLWPVCTQRTCSLVFAATTDSHRRLLRRGSRLPARASASGMKTPRPPTSRSPFHRSSCHFPIDAARRVTMDHIQPFSCAALGSRSHSAPSEAAPRAGASATANPKSRLAISIATATPASHAVAKPPIDLWLNWACQRPFRPG